MLIMMQRLSASHNQWKGNEVRILSDNCRCVHRMFLYPLSKDSHWETEKAGYKNADESVYMVRVTRPALILFRKGFMQGIMFSDKVLIIAFLYQGLFLLYLSELWPSQENSAVVIFQKEKLPQFFYCLRLRRWKRKQ